MNNDEKNELEQTQVIEIPEEETTSESMPTVELPSMDDVVEPSVANEEAMPVDNVVNVEEEDVNVVPEPVNEVHEEITPEVEMVKEENTVAPESEPVSEAAPVEVTTATTPEPQVTNVNTGNDFIEKEKKRWPIVLILVLLVLGGLIAYYFLIYTKPINIINKLLNTAYSDVKKASNSSSNGDIDINSFIFDSSFTMTSDNKEYADYSGMNVKAYVAYDLKDNKNNKIDLSMALKEQKMLDIAMSFVGNKTYYDLKEAFPKVVYMETDEELMSMDNILIDQKEVNDTVNDSLYILEVVKNAISKNISEEKLSKKMLMKDIDGKKIPAIEINYKIDYKEYKKLRTAVYDALLSDDKAISILAKLNDDTIASVKEDLTDEKDDFSELDFAGDVDIVIDTDAFTNKLVAMEIKGNDSKITLRGTSTETNIDITSEGLGTISITIDKKENKVFADFKLNILEQAFRFSVTVKYNEISKTSYDINASVVIYDTQDINKEALTITGEFKIDLNKAITTVNTVDATNVNDLTPAEAKKFSAALESLDGLSAIAEGAM